MVMKVLAKVSLVFTLSASVCLIIGIATPSWLSSNGRYQGLWISCYYLTHSDGHRECTKLDSRPDFENWVQAVRALEILSCICTVISLVLLFCYIRRDDGRSNLIRIRTSILLSIVSFIFCMIGIILYAAKRDQSHLLLEYHLSWSYILTTLGGAMMLVIVIPLLIEVKRSRVLGTYESI